MPAFSDRWQGPLVVIRVPSNDKNTSLNQELSAVVFLGGPSLRHVNPWATVPSPRARQTSITPDLSNFRSHVIENQQATESGLVGSRDASASCLRSFRGGLSESWSNMEDSPLPVWVVGDLTARSHRMQVACRSSGDYKRVIGDLLNR